MIMKISIPEMIEANEGYDVALIGIGEIGKTALQAFNLQYSGPHWAAKSITLCDDEAFQHRRYANVIHPTDNPFYLAEQRRKVLEICKSPEVLFVFMDASEDPDFEHACRFANVHRQQNVGKPLSICVCTEKLRNSFTSSVLASLYDVVIWADTHGNDLCKPAEMLLSDMYTQCIGLDIADVFEILKHSQEMYLLTEHRNSKTDLSKVSSDILATISTKEIQDTFVNFIAYVSIPQDGGIDIPDNIIWPLLKPFDSDLRMQYGFNKDTDDNSVSVTLLVGNYKKHRETDDFPTMDISAW